MIEILVGIGLLLGVGALVNAFFIYVVGVPNPGKKSGGPGVSDVHDAGHYGDF